MRTWFLGDQLLRLGRLLCPQVLQVHVFRLAQATAVDQAHCCGRIQVQIQFAFCLQVLRQALNTQSSRCGLAAYCSLSAVDNDTSCCFLVHTLKQCSPLVITPANSVRRVVLSPHQSASEYASNPPICCQRNRHTPLGIPARYLLIPFTRSMSRTDGLANAQQTCFDANLRSGRSCDR